MAARHIRAFFLTSGGRSDHSTVRSKFANRDLCRPDPPVVERAESAIAWAFKLVRWTSAAGGFRGSSPGLEIVGSKGGRPRFSMKRADRTDEAADDGDSAIRADATDADAAPPIPGDSGESSVAVTPSSRSASGSSVTVAPSSRSASGSSVAVTPSSRSASGSSVAVMPSSLI